MGSTGKGKDSSKDRQAATQRKSAGKAPVEHSAPESVTAAQASGFLSGVQRQLAIGQSGDPYEREADHVANDVVHGASPAVQPISRLTPGSLSGAMSQRPAEEEELVQALPLQRQSEEVEDPVQALPLQRQAADEEPVQAKASRSANSAETLATIHSPGPGEAMPTSVRSRIETYLGSDMRGVRVHADSAAQRAARNLGARAFAHGNHIFLGRNESSRDLHLMAHEATHVVQQGAALALPRGAVSPTSFAIQRLPLGLGEFVNDYARHIPGYTLFTVIVGFNPLTGTRVERNAVNLLHGLMGLVPFGTFIFDTLQERGTIQQAFGWVEGELGRANLSLARIEQTLENAWDDVQITAGFDYNLAVLRRHFGQLLRDVESFARSLVSQIMQMIKDAAIGVAEDLLAENRAWALIKKILHHNPLKDEPVDATTVEILEDVLLLIGKEQELEQMRERGTLERTAAWLDTQLATFLSLLSELRSLFTSAWEAIQPENLPNLSSNLQNVAGQAAGFLQRVWTFAATVAITVLEFIKDALLGWLRSFAHEIPGYHLLTVILGRDVFTQEAVPRTPTNLIRGFMSLMPGGEQQFQEMQQTGVTPEAAQRIETLMSELGISWAFVRGLFIGIWDSLSIADLINPIEAFARITNQFGEPISRLFAFVTQVVKIVLELVLQMMNFPLDIIQRIISNALQAFDDIKRDPIGFLKNMLAAVKQGFSSFFDNILRHLLSGVVDWLFGQLRKAGIEPPADFSLSSVLGFVLEVLGISMERIWEKLAAHIGQERVDRIRGAIDRLSGIWNFVRDVQERGVVAIWEYIQSQISNLWNMVLEKAREWIVTRIIERVVAKLLSMLDPTGIMAVVNSFIAFFNAVQSAIEYFREMLMIVDEYVSMIAGIARGALESGAAKLEQALANAIPVAIGFLANQVGLGNIGEKIAEIVGGVRQVVDRALDWLLDRAVSLGQSVLRMLGMGGEETEGEEPVDASDHEAVANRAAAELAIVETPPANYVALRSEKESQARQIEQRYTALLEPGIGLTVHFEEQSTDAADSDIDYEVVIAPNTKSKKGSIPFGPSNGIQFENGILTMPDGKKFAVGSEIAVARGGGWQRGPNIITAIAEREVSGVDIIMITYENQTKPDDSGSISAPGYPRIWRAPIESLQVLADEELDAENAKEAWGTFTLAKKVLNYRAHEVQHVNPAGKDWEHIVEQGSLAIHSSENLALADSGINNRLAAYYKTVRRYPELALEDIVEAVALRDYLNGKDAETQQRWKLKIYRNEFRVSLKWRNHTRGKYQVLE